MNQSAYDRSRAIACADQYDDSHLVSAYMLYAVRLPDECEEPNVTEYFAVSDHEVGNVGVSEVFIGTVENGKLLDGKSEWCNFDEKLAREVYWESDLYPSDVYDTFRKWVEESLCKTK